jgi:hypothetical protein
VKPLVDKAYLLERFPGKGGWTFARIPEVLQDKHAPFGWVRVKGTVDGFEISKYHLMPMGSGQLFLPVKAAIREKIKKNEGDFVHVVLFRDDDPVEVPEEFMLCLKDEPSALRFFKKLSDNEQLNYVQWIYAAKKEETKIERIATAINRLALQKKYYDK